VLRLLRSQVGTTLRVCSAQALGICHQLRVFCHCPCQATVALRRQLLCCCLLPANNSNRAHPRPSSAPKCLFLLLLLLLALQVRVAHRPSHDSC
jgi:hypothetical protein